MQEVDGLAGHAKDVGLPHAAYAALIRMTRSLSSVDHTEVVHQLALQVGAQL